MIFSNSVVIAPVRYEVVMYMTQAKELYRACTKPLEAMVI